MVFTLAQDGKPGCATVAGKVDREVGLSLKDHSLYNSKAWQKTRDAYRRRVGGLCEACYSRGIIKPGEIVHHKIPITPDNIDNPEITLSFDNLQLLCRDCHATAHDTKQRRYTIDELGRVTCL